MNKRYEYGDLSIYEHKLFSLIKDCGPGDKSTFEIIKIYQGGVINARGGYPGQSWAAYFGKVLKKFSDDNPDLIVEVESNVRQNEYDSNCSIWRIF